jgi:NAD(P)-dependent dehydrogenase (short-subunit alcohol dehydrogenase family)
MSTDKKNYNSPFQATLTGIFNLFRKRARIGVLSSKERLEGKKILIDGSSSGLGFASAVELAKRGGTVIMAVRSGFPEKMEEVKKKANSDKIFIHQVDMSDFVSIKKLVIEVKNEQGKLDIVICNAAVVSKKSVQTKSGLEQMFMVNYFSKFYLVKLLLENDCFNTESKHLPRIIFVASESHRNAGEFNWKDFGNYIPYNIGKTVELYGYYKLLLVTFARELSQRLNEKETRFSVFALCPGPVNSNIAREAPGIFKPLLRLVFTIFFRSPEKACEPVLYHAASKQQEGKQFDYLFLMERKAIDEKADDPKNGEKLWNLSEDLLKKLKVDEC